MKIQRLGRTRQETGTQKSKSLLWQWGGVLAIGTAISCFMYRKESLRARADEKKAKDNHAVGQPAFKPLTPDQVESAVQPDTYCYALFVPEATRQQIASAMKTPWQIIAPAKIVKNRDSQAAVMGQGERIRVVKTDVKYSESG